MAQGLPNSLLIDSVTILRPVRSMATGTKQPIVTETVQATGVRVRIEPLSGGVRETVMGRLPEATHRLFTNSQDVKVNDVLQLGVQKFVVREVGDFFGHHLEAILEQKND